MTMKRLKASDYNRAVAALAERERSAAAHVPLTDDVLIMITAQQEDRARHIAARLGEVLSVNLRPGAVCETSQPDGTIAKSSAVKPAPRGRGFDVSLYGVRQLRVVAIGDAPAVSATADATELDDLRLLRALVLRVENGSHGGVLTNWWSIVQAAQKAKR
jgi:hypothetical protein